MILLADETKPIMWERDGRSLILANLEPVVIYGGSKEKEYDRYYKVQLPDAGAPFFCKTIWTFIGADRGDVMEADIEIQNDGFIYGRSYHKHSGFDSWDSWEPFFFDSWLRDDVNVILRGRVVGRNENSKLPFFGKLQARPHFGVRLVGVGGEI